MTANLNKNLRKTRNFYKYAIIFCTSLTKIVLCIPILLDKQFSFLKNISLDFSSEFSKT